MDKRLLPDFVLPTLGGERIAIEDFEQRRELLVALLHSPPCDACHAFTRAADALGSDGLRGAVLLGLFDSEEAARRAEDEAGGGGAMLRLIDSSGDPSRRLRAAASIPGGAASLVVADRFGVLYAALPIHGRDPKAVLDDAHGWIDFIQMQCPECGVPVW